MSYAPVALGTPVQSASGSGITGLAYGAAPTAGNLLICWWTGQGSATTPSSPAGWSQGQGKTSTNVAVVPYYKIAAGGDAVPAFAAITGSVQSAMLGEFSGNVAATPKDQLGSAATTAATTPLTATLAAADTTFGDLVVYVGGVLHSAAVTDSASVTVNSVAATSTTNNATSTVDHFCFGYGVTTSNASADSIALTHSTTSLTSTALSAISFKVLFVQRHGVATLASTLGLTATAKIRRTGHATLASNVGLAATGVVTIVPKLVGSLGTPVQSTSGGAISGLAYGQTPTAGHLLVCWWSGQGVTTLPANPSGWTTQETKGGTSEALRIFTKIAAGSDAVPTFIGVTSSVQTVMLGEFSGAASAVDQSGNTSFPLTSPMSCNLVAKDQRAPELIIYGSNVLHSAAVTDSAVTTLNNGAVAHDTNNNATSTVDHYNFGYGVTTSNAAIDTVSTAFNATSVTGVALGAFSLKWAGSVLSNSARITPVATLGLTATATSIVVGAKGSPASFAGTLGLSASASVIGAGPGSTGQASMASTLALHAVGSVFDPPKHGQATFSATASLTATGKVLHRAHATLSSTLGLSARGVAKRHGLATLASHLTFGGTAHVARHGTTTLASTLALSATGLRAQPDLGTAVLHATLAFHASGRLHHVGHVTLAPALALSAKAHVTRGAHATLAATLGLSATARRHRTSSAGFFPQLALTARAQVNRVDAGLLNATLGLNANGFVGTIVLLGQITLVDDTLALIALTDED